MLISHANTHACLLSPRAQIKCIPRAYYFRGRGATPWANINFKNHVRSNNGTNFNKYTTIRACRHLTYWHYPNPTHDSTTLVGLYDQVQATSRVNCNHHIIRFVCWQHTFTTPNIQYHSQNITIFSSNHFERVVLLLKYVCSRPPPINCHFRG